MTDKALTEMTVSTARLGDAEHVFLAVRTESPQAADLASAVGEALATSGCEGAGVVRVVCFVRDMAQTFEIRAGLAGLLGSALPATEVLVQPALATAGLEAQVWAVRPGPATVQRHVVGTTGAGRTTAGATARGGGQQETVTVLRQDEATLACVGGISADPGISGYAERFLDCFQRFDLALREVGLDYADSVHTWSLFGDCGPTGRADGVFQSFNQARKDFFATIGFDRYAPSSASVYPGNTGVAIADRQPVLSGIACRPGPEGLLVALGNPEQLAPQAYPSTTSRVAPLFSRAVALVGRREVWVFVSGTGSVVGSLTSDIGSVTDQTNRVLSLVDVLVSEANLKHHGVQVAAGGLERLVRCTVYLPNPEAFPTVSRTCGERLPSDVPVSYVHAGLTRDSLLVEMDALAVLPRVA